MVRHLFEEIDLKLKKRKNDYYGEAVMIKHDTIELLRECDEGIQMGIGTLDDVKDHVTNDEFRKCLDDYQREYANLQNEMEELLHTYHDKGKDPNPLAQGMAWMKTNMTITFNDSVAKIADIITDGCNMGIKSLNKYLNQYKAADDRAKDFAKRLINLQERQVEQMRQYL